MTKPNKDLLENDGIQVFLTIVAIAAAFGFVVTQIRACETDKASLCGEMGGAYFDQKCHHVTEGKR